MVSIPLLRPRTVQTRAGGSLEGEGALHNARQSSQNQRQAQGKHAHGESRQLYVGGERPNFR